MSQLYDALERGRVDNNISCDCLRPSSKYETRPLQDTPFAHDGSVRMTMVLDEETIMIAYLAVLLVPVTLGIVLGLLRDVRFGKISMILLLILSKR